MAENSRTQLITELNTLLTASAHLQRVAALRRKAGDRQASAGGKATGKNTYRTWRALTRSELARLEAQGNRSPDWSKIKVAPDFTPDYVYGCYLGGVCLLGRFDGRLVAPEEGILLPCGLYGSTIIDSVIEENCLIHHVGLLANYLVLKDVIVFQTSALKATAHCTFGNGEELVVGSETGGREVLSYAEMSPAVANAVILERRDRDFQEQYRKFVASYKEAGSLPCGVVEAGSVIRHSGKITDTYAGAASLIDNATRVHNCTLLGSTEEPVGISDGAQLSHTCLQWGCKVGSQALVEHAVLMEHAHVERQGKVCMSILGANTGVAEGEVTSSLVGPFVGFHHQALLIAALWPAGKGNIGYGANVGSNHTGKAPDQELLAGEGCFFGLGVNIKYPANYLKAPYTLFATGVDTLPQELAFPFSLINKPARMDPALPPAYNEIFPGWVLSQNIYSLIRNEEKYKKRNRARRQSIPWRILRPEIIELMQTASLALAGIQTAAKPDRIYTDKDIPGLGKNFMTEESRRQALTAYAFYSEYYALQSMWTCLKEHEVTIRTEKQMDLLLTTGLAETEGECLRRVWLNLALDRRSLEANLARLIELQERVCRSAEQSKERDHVRAQKIMGEYHLAHDLLREDSVLAALRAETEQLKAQVAGWLQKR